MSPADKAVSAVAVTPDGTQAVSASYDGTLKVWNLASGQEERTLRGHSLGVSAVVGTSDGRRAVSVSYDSTLKVWDLRSGQAIATFSAESPLDDCDVAPDGQTFVAAGQSGRVHFLRLEAAD